VRRGSQSPGGWRRTQSRLAPKPGGPRHWGARLLALEVSCLLYFRFWENQGNDVPSKKARNKFVSKLEACENPQRGNHRKGFLSKLRKSTQPSEGPWASCKKGR